MFSELIHTLSLISLLAMIMSSQSLFILLMEFTHLFLTWSKQSLSHIAKGKGILWLARSCLQRCGMCILCPTESLVPTNMLPQVVGQQGNTTNGYDNDCSTQHDGT